MKESESFGIEKGNGAKVLAWMNEEANDKQLKFEGRLYDHDITTKNFGLFEMFSWMGDVQVARNLILKASKRFKVKVIEGGYRTKERTLSTKKTDFAMVRKGDKIIGHLEFESSRLRSQTWKVKGEERR